jgi:hypothetical protein
MTNLRLFEAKALAKALNDSGYAVSARTVQRWKAGQQPHPQDLAAIERVLNVKKETLPAWAEALDAKVTATHATVERVAEMLAAMAAAQGSGPNPPLVDDPGDARAGTRPRGKLGR